MPDEIVICDDGSKDGTVEVVRETLRGWDGRLQFVRNPKNLGFRKNFEKAVSLCHGDIIFLSDQDDVWLPEKIEILTRTLEETGAVMAFHDVELVDLSLAPLLPSFWQVLHFNPAVHGRDMLRRLLANNVVQGSACAFRRELFDKAYPFPEEAVHDEWLALIAGMTGEIVPVQRVLMKYRQGNNQIGGIPLTLTEKLRQWSGTLRAKLRQHEEIRSKWLSVAEECERRGQALGAPEKRLALLSRYVRFQRTRQTLSAPLKDYKTFSYSGYKAAAEFVKDVLGRWL